MVFVLARDTNGTTFAGDAQKDSSEEVEQRAGWDHRRIDATRARQRLSCR